MAPTKTKEKRQESTFDFLGLPRELRDMVYEEYIKVSPPAKGLFTWRKNPVQTYRVSSRDLTIKRTIGRFKGQGLLLVSKQVHAEYAEMLYKSSDFTFRIQEVDYYSRLAGWRLSPNLMANMRVATFVCGMETTFAKDLNDISKVKANLNQLLSSSTAVEVVNFLGTSSNSNRSVQAVDEIGQTILDASEANSNIREVKFSIHQSLKIYQRNKAGQLVVEKLGMVIERMEHWDDFWFNPKDEWHLKLENGSIETIPVSSLQWLRGIHV